MSNLAQFKAQSTITLTSTTIVEPTSDSDSVQIIDPSLSTIFYLRSGNVANRVYFKLLDGTYDGQSVKILRDRNNGWHSYDAGSGTGDSGLTVHYKSVDYTGYPAVGYKWTWDSDVGYGAMNTSFDATWSKNHWIIITTNLG